MKPIHSIYIIVGAFAVTIAGLWFFAINPRWQGIKQASREIMAVRAEALSMDQQTAELEKFKQAYENLKPGLAVLDGAFVDVENPVDFIEFLENAAASSGLVAHISLTPDSGKEAPSNYISLQVNTEGADFAGIIRFAEELETGPYLITIKKLDIRKSESLAVSAGLEASLHLEAVAVAP